VSDTGELKVVSSMALSARGRGDVVRRKMLLEEDVSGGQEELWEENYFSRIRNPSVAP
jgi:hypothetical protein